MSTRRDNVGIISLHESCRREPPLDATPEAIQAQIDAFKARGGHIQELPAGVTAYTYSTRPDKQRAKDDYASAMARKPKQHSQIKLKGSMSGE